LKRILASFIFQIRVPVVEETTILANERSQARISVAKEKWRPETASLGKEPTNGEAD
jgi:hypothetical protein